ncbi:DUF732 domain-containing protein [Pseudonocardia sp. KRD-184]|uniref:DUF732 domain-containing protein n=1 Tax=Pseudonocardia oceani TaxID=2792013 RepID=A0ABS6UFV5_9PSEU|nr:DUF732 domain-containing protein [Pseudonocardia oceani]MBW0090122.1 DUF732 domain-containing protein [Pseudonocardia oceani]MBW0095488.1 DUF732 domain-containing protein [Pseudonocardia oceani]MBW0109944.1 DUF732 domain-containing protein [Pseudonocardia oceani]MBW0122148.1 DUF732 domain-containing protein [Pseudonocardia oceani]MBW0131117.1 DUF732 domain-containing protein [Pseudonocardia oceani]
MTEFGGGRGSAVGERGSETSGAHHGYGDDPNARDPYARDPYAPDLYAPDLYNRDRYAQDPHALDPYAGYADPDRDLLLHGDLPVPDAALRRQAAEANARAAEATAAAAAADAKAAIALAARAAAAADAAAQAAVRADAVVRAAAMAEVTRVADAAAPAAIPGEPDAPTGLLPLGVPHGVPPVPFANTMTDTDVMPQAVVPFPRSVARHDADADSGAFAVPGTAPEGRAARRRAAAAETTVFATSDGAADGETVIARLDDTGPDGARVDGARVDGARVDTAAASADPQTELVDALPEEPAEPAVSTGSRRRRARAAAAYEAEDTGERNAVTATGGRAAARKAKGARKGLFRRRGPLLAAGAAVGVLAVAGVVLVGNGGSGDSGGGAPAPAAVVESQVPVLPFAAAPAETEEQAPDQGDPRSDRAERFLSGLRAAGVPTSRSGAEETEAAELVCRELADGVDEARIARALPATLPSVTRAEAADLVEVARESYCTTS